MSFVALLISFSAALLLLVSTIAFLKAKDVFIMTHIVMIANTYIIPLLLIGVEIDRFSWLSFAKIIALIVLNLVVVNLLCHATLRRAMINKISPDAEVRS
jgi:multisubunit Na+/H+ antiporter MnhG subunit